MRLLSIALVVFQFGSYTLESACGQDDAPNADAQKNAEVAAEFAAVESKRYVITPATAKQPLLLADKTLLRWTNPERAEVYGSVVLWTRDDCPAALASIYTYFDRKQLNVELVSLSESRLTGMRSGKERWVADQGVKFETFPDGPPPAATAEKRQLQMRTIARKFSAHLADRADDTKFSELRLMARPLHQYSASDRSGREGALFAFVTANDPEVLLLVESQLEKDVRIWRYAAARLNFCRLQLHLNEKAVWDVPQLAPPWEKLRGPQGNYVILEWATMAAAEADAR